MTRQRSGAPHVRMGAAPETSPNQEADPKPQFTGSGNQAEPVTAGDDHPAWIQRLKPGKIRDDAVRWIQRLEHEQAEQDEIRDAVHRLIARATIVHGILPVGSPEFWAAPATVQLASIAVLGQEYLPEHPMKQAASGISGALDWRAEASRPSYAELQRRRSIPITPVRCQAPGCGRVHYLEHPLPDVYLCDHHPRTQRRGAAA